MKPTIAAALCLWLWACGDQDHADAPASLAAVVAEPPGANCAAGGEAIETGVDRNDNGVLDADEVTATTYVCSAAPGSTTLIDVVAVPPGAHCANGGQAIETGVDANGNGVLDADEIQSTSYVCQPSNPTIIDGSFTVTNSVDAAELIGVTAITGNLTINAIGLSSIDLSALETVGGTITYTAFSGSTLAMPALTSAGGIVVTGATVDAPLDLPVLATVGSISLTQYNFATATFPVLTTIGTSLTVQQSNALTTLTFPVLTAVGTITVANCPAITALDFSHVTTMQQVALSGDNDLVSVSLHDLSSVTGLSFSNLAALSTIDLSSLSTASQGIDIEQASVLAAVPLSHVTSVGSLTLSNLAAPIAIDLSSLTTVNGSLNISYSPALASIDLSSLEFVGAGMYITNDGALGALTFPALTSVASSITGGAATQIAYDAVLASISAPLWTTFGPTPATSNVQIGFYFNPDLPTCQAQALANQMGSLNAAIFDNDDSAICP